MTRSAPRLSIITVHLDDGPGLALTRDSLARLERRDYEWLVVDGGSDQSAPDTRGVLEAAAAFADRFISGPDAGTYDAMNRGTALATGAWVLYLNAGDTLHPDFRPSDLLGAAEDEGHGMVWGTCHERYPDGELVAVRTRPPGAAWYGMPVNHQNILFRRELLGSEPYDLRWRYYADYDLLGRLLAAGVAARVSERPIAVFSRGGASAVDFHASLREEAELRSRHFGVPRWLSALIYQFKCVNFRLSGWSGLRRIWRRWV